MQWNLFAMSAQSLRSIDFLYSIGSDQENTIYNIVESVLSSAIITHVQNMDVRGTASLFVLRLEYETRFQVGPVMKQLQNFQTAKIRGKTASF